MNSLFFINRLGKAVHRKTSWGQACLSAMVVVGFAGAVGVTGLLFAVVTLPGDLARAGAEGVGYAGET